MSIVPFKYSKIQLMVFQCSRVGFNCYWLTSLTTKHIHRSIHMIAYVRLPTTLEYGYWTFSFLVKFWDTLTLKVLTFSHEQHVIVKNSAISTIEIST